MNSNHRKQRDAAIIKRILAPPRNDNDHIQVYDIYDDNGIYVDSKAVIDMKARSREKGKVGNVSPDKVQNQRGDRKHQSPSSSGGSKFEENSFLSTMKSEGTSLGDPSGSANSTNSKWYTKLKDQTATQTLLPHEIFKDEVKFTTSNIWPDSFTLKEIGTYCRDNTPGVIVCDLPPGHPLHGKGEMGLFASKEFEPFDVIGSYTGSYVNADTRGFPNSSLVTSGHYLAQLEMPRGQNGKRVQLGINAESCGNEMRFINSYLNIADVPNAIMKTTFIDREPHVVVVCTRHIDILEEILLDYGEAYHQTYLVSKAHSEQLSAKELYSHLPPLDTYESDIESEDGYEM